MQKILVTLDGSACSEHALPSAVALARATGAELTFLYVVTDPLNVYNMEGSPVHEPEYHRELVRQGETALARAAEQAAAAGVGAHTLLRETRSADPLTEILEAEANFDLTVMASHGRRGYDRLTLGSVTERLLRRSDKPHLVVRCPGRENAKGH